MTNYDLSVQVFNFLNMIGVDHVVVCAGARNAPMVLALEKQNFKVINYFEERSAAFFALGLIKSFGKPVAIMTTSGTAAAELLPATIEAHYQGLPLILITADRPKSYRGTGSPQTIEQVGIFKNYVESEYDFDVHSTNFSFRWSYKSPIHFNVAFDEPLIDEPSDKLPQIKIHKTHHEHELAVAKFTGSRPLIIVGELEPQYQEKVAEFILGIRAPVYAESMSLLRKYPQIERFMINSGEKFINYIFEQDFCDSVIRIGNIPTLRFWRDLEGEFKDVSVVNYTDLPFSGLSRETILIEIAMLNPFQNFPADVFTMIKKIDMALQVEKDHLLSKYPLSEPAMVRRLSEFVKRDPVYLGNSLPIRHWDQFANVLSKAVYANRGANGIDGQISTYLGWSERYSKSYCLVGDLTALYDMASLGFTPQLRPYKRFVVIMNNFGGQIFNRVFKNDRFINAHKTQFYHWAKMWNWSYLQILTTEDFDKIDSFNTPNVVVEIVPDAQQTEKFWTEWDLICQSI